MSIAFCTAVLTMRLCSLQAQYVPDLNRAVSVVIGDKMHIGTLDFNGSLITKYTFTLHGTTSQPESVLLNGIPRRLAPIYNWNGSKLQYGMLNKSGVFDASRNMPTIEIDEYISSWNPYLIWNLPGHISVSRKK